VGAVRLRSAANANNLAMIAYKLARSEHWRTQPRAPSGNEDGGQWISAGNASRDEVAEVIYVCTQIGSVRVTDEFGRAAYAVSYLCGYDNRLLSWITTRRLRPIILDPRF
jgi:hypothetical protein